MSVALAMTDGMGYDMKNIIFSTYSCSLPVFRV